jgi:hypothetical protein
VASPLGRGVRILHDSILVCMDLSDIIANIHELFHILALVALALTGVGCFALPENMNARP